MISGDNMKNKLLNYMTAMTKKVTELETIQLTASVIAQELETSRNLVSQYLNELVSEGIIIKTNTRPVYFFKREVLEEKYQKRLEKVIFSSLHELSDILNGANEVKDFDKLIGGNDSLHYVVEQCKASISYPPEGLPILIHGPTGTGKSMIATLMYEYACNQGIIEKGAKFITINCSEYANNPELLTANLFGSKKGSYTGAEKDNIGMIKAAENGILFLDEVHCLRAECQEKLFLFMDKGIYHMLGDNEHTLSTKVRLIFATTENPEDALLRTLLRRIPIMVDIPALDQRPVLEKKQLIYHVLSQESLRIKKDIFISNQVYQTLINTTFLGNVGGIKNHMKAACANAFLNEDKKEDRINIHIYNLPEYVLQQIPIISTKLLDQNDIQMMNVKSLVNYSDSNSRLIKLYNKILAVFDELQATTISYTAFLHNVHVLLSDYNDQVMFDKPNINKPSLDFTRKIVDKIFSITINRYGIKISNNNILSYAKYLDDYTKFNFEIKTWTQAHYQSIKTILGYFEQRLAREYHIAKEIIDNVKLNLDIELDDMAKLTLILNLRGYNKEVVQGTTMAIILAHGYSTASSIADAANKFLGQYIFDAIDMQLDVCVEKILEQLNDFLKQCDSFDELILLVDMGSLEQIYKGIDYLENCNIGILNNITTKIALEVGNGILRGKGISEMFQEITENQKLSFKYIDNKTKTNAILTVCPTGLGSAKKITELLVSSFPGDLPIKIIVHDYQSLQEQGIHDSIFSRYHVLAIIGTMNPNVVGVPYLAIEEIVLNSNVDILYHIFSAYLDEQSIQKLSDNLLKNFTLSNIVNHLTILNANKVLEDVEVVVARMESGMNVKLNSTVKVGLYVHLCCLIERLIMKNEVGILAGLQAFEAEHQDFITIVRESASVIEKQYSVEIPVTEIGYIYNYMMME